MKKILPLILCSFINLTALYTQWQPDVRLTNDPAFSRTSDNNAKCIAADGNTVHVVWQDHRDGNWEIYYKRSTDGGISWGNDTRLTIDTVQSNDPAIAVSGLQVYILWYQSGKIYYKASVDGGVSWQPNVYLTDGALYPPRPILSVSGSHINVIWTDERSESVGIYCKYSSNSGLKWSADARLSMNNGRGGSITSINNFVYAVWTYTPTAGRPEVWYKRSTNYGMSWSVESRVANGVNGSSGGRVAASGNTVHLSWQDFRDGNYELYYKRSTNSGINWSNDLRLTNDNDNSYAPSISSGASAVHIVWRDERNSSRGIYYKRSLDNGLTWETDRLLSDSAGGAYDPSVTVSGESVHAVWNDYIYGNNLEIYYKRNPTGNPIGINNIGSEIPNNFKLQQNYPNPFNPETNIKFQIPASAIVNITVYDILGRRIESLVNESLNPGIYEVNWNASNNPSGIYYYKLTTSNFSETRKMILLK